MKKQTLILGISLIFTSSLFAGDLKYGFKAGLNYGGFSGNGNDVLKNSMGLGNQSQLGYGVGGHLEYQMTDILSLFPEVNVVIRKSKGSKDVGSTTNESDITQINLEVPIVLNYVALTNWNLYSGGYAGFNLSNHSSAKNSSGSFDLSIKQNVDYGIILGSGYRLDKWVFDARYVLGLSNFVKEVKFGSATPQTNLDYKQSSIEFSAEYSF